MGTELRSDISCFELIEAPATEPIMYNYPKEKLWKVVNFLERRVNYMHFNFNLCKSLGEERFVVQHYDMEFPLLSTMRLNS